jgi:hypothetical protein
MPATFIDAYHGTSEQGAVGILKDGYNESSKEDEWLGHGVYFFVDGVSDPFANAQEWARAQAYEDGRYKYERYAVLKSEISLDEDKILDITSTEGLKAFNEAKERLFHKIEKNFRTAFKKPDTHNCILFNYMLHFAEVHAVKHNLYIKTIRERKLKLRLNVPNTTVLCVRKENLVAKSEVLCKGAVK